MKILYSFNKRNYEGDCYKNEIASATTPEHQFIAFNHEHYLNPKLYIDAWKLDRLYRQRHPGLMKLYSEFEARIRDEKIDAIIVSNCPPYHPDFLKGLPAYKVLYSSDDPDSTYRRNIPYLHAYNHVFYVDPAYSSGMTMHDKMAHCGMVNADWVPMGVMDFEFNGAISEEALFANPRDIDIIYIGGFFFQKLGLLARIKKVFGPRLRLHGFFRLKHNLYYNVRHGFPGWVTPVSYPKRVQLYQRAKIGFNIHWDDYGLGNQRLYHLPANGVMQISDCGEHIEQVFKIGSEVDVYKRADDLIEKLRYYLENEEARTRIARESYRRTMREYRYQSITRQAAKLIQTGMERIGWSS